MIILIIEKRPHENESSEQNKDNKNTNQQRNVSLSNINATHDTYGNMVSRRGAKKVNNRERDNTLYNPNNRVSQRSISEINETTINRNTSERSIKTPARYNVANTHSTTVPNTDYFLDNNNRNNNDNIIDAIACTGSP